MTDPDPAAVPREPDIDENGVDLAQVRAMLDLEPAQRLSRMTEFMNDLIATRGRNGTRGAG
jgi:hypothetical protein